MAARVTTSHPDQGWSLLCNGIVLFDDAGMLLPGSPPPRGADQPANGRRHASQQAVPRRRLLKGQKEMTAINEPLADARDMFAAHTMFRREFGLMPGLVRTAAAGDRQRSGLVASHVAMVSGVLNHHHSGEDEYVWPRLRERCPDDCAPLADVMEDQHHAIHTALLQVAQAGHAWRHSASADARHMFVGTIDRLLPVMNEHLALEEERVVPLIEKYVTQAEYARVAQEQGAEVPTDKLPVVLGMFMYEAEPAAIDLAVAEMPAEVQPVIRDVAPKAYAAYAQELYGTPVPPRATS
jgi:hypothetical protein